MSFLNIPPFIWTAIKRHLSRSIYSKFATTLIILGIGLLAPGIREFLLNFVIGVINSQFEDVSFLPYTSKETIWPFFIAVCLIFSGLIIFIIGWKIDHKKKKIEEEQDAQAVIYIANSSSHIHLKQGNKNELDPRISTGVLITIITGSKPLKLRKVLFHRYVQGCIMLPCTPTLKRHSTKEVIVFGHDWESLREPYSIPADDQATFTLSREFCGPTMRYYYDQLETGDLDITLTYSLGNCNKQHCKRFILHQKEGTLTETGQLKKPPLLNDDALAKALSNKVITQEELDHIMTIDERRRFLYIRDGAPYLKSHVDLRDQPKLLKLLEDVDQRIKEAHDSKAENQEMQ